MGKRNEYQPKGGDARQFSIIPAIRIPTGLTEVISDQHHCGVASVPGSLELCRQLLLITVYETHRQVWFVCEWQVELCDPIVNTRAISECFRDKELI